MENNSIIFDNEVITPHTLTDKGFLCKLNAICFRDYNKASFNDNILCLDLDKYEISLNPSSLNCTMDAAIGISNYINNRKVNKRILLVELRLNYKNAKNLSGTELKHKSSHSRDLLGQEISIDNHDIFIFNDSIFEQAKRVVRQLAIEQGCKDKWISLTISNFKNRIQDIKGMPYTPINNSQTIVQEIHSSHLDIDKLILITEKWLNIARKYKYQCNFQEALHICFHTLKSLNTILCQETLAQESQWYLEEEIKCFEGLTKAIKKDM